MTNTAELLDDAGIEHFVFDDVDWNFYELILRKVSNRRVFVTFDGSRLEVAARSFLHSRLAVLLAELVRLGLLEMRIPFESVGSFTLKKRTANAGLEPDCCVYIANAEFVLGRRTVNLERDPVPDLVIEIETGARELDRIETYRRIGIPEVWCYDGRRSRVLCLKKGGYEEVACSPALPDLPLEDIHGLIEQSWKGDDLTWTKSVQQWLREHLPRSPQT